MADQHPLTLWRKERNVTKGKLAKAIGVSWRTLHRIEHGTATPTLDVTLAIERETEAAVTAEMLAAARHEPAGAAA